MEGIDMIGEEREAYHFCTEDLRKDEARVRSLVSSSYYNSPGKSGMPAWTEAVAVAVGAEKGGQKAEGEDKMMTCLPALSGKMITEEQTS